MDFFGVSKKLALGLLALLPRTTSSQSNPNSWVSLQGRLNEKDAGVSLTLADDGSIIASGNHNRGHPNYDGEIIVLNSDGALTSNIQVAAGTSTYFQGSAWYNETVFSTGHIIKEGITHGFLCGTTLNGTLFNGFELSGLPGATQFSGILASSENTLILAGKDAVVMSIYPNGTSKFRYQYPISDAVSLTAIVETDDKDYVTSGFISRNPGESFVAKINNNGGLIWARELQSSINVKCQINSISEKNDIVFAVGNLDNNGVVLQLNATTGSTLNVTTLEGSSATSFFSGSFVDNQFVAAGFSLTSSPGSRGSIVFNGQDVKMLAGTQLDFFKAAATDTNGQFVSTGTTKSYNGDFNNDKFMTVKFGPDFTLDDSDIPSGLSFYSVTNDFTINYNAGIINNDITGSITPIDLTLTTNFTDITDEITVTHPLTTEFLSTNSPSGNPSAGPTGQPSGTPSARPSRIPTRIPSANPSGNPSGQPSGAPSARPSRIPTRIPSANPSGNPSGNPTGNPSGQPSGAPSARPSRIPTRIPSANPSGNPSSCPSAEPSADPTSRPTVVGETHAPTVGIIPNWGNVWGVMDHSLSPIDVTQTADYVLGLVNLYTQDNSALMLFDKLDGVLSPYYLSWETTAAVAEGNNLYIAGKTENREPTLVKIDLEDKVLTWGKRLPSSLYTIVDVNIQANGQLVTTIENRHNYQSTGSILIEEHDATSGLTLSNQAYVSSLFTRPIFARPIKGMAFINDNTYVAGQYTFQSQYLTCIVNTVIADFYILSAGYPLANNLDRPLAITSGSNSLYLLTSSIRSANFYYNLVRLNQVESTLSMAENWPIRTAAILNDIALMHVDNLEYLATCGQANARFFMLKLDAQGNKIAELNIFYGQKELTCASLTYTRHGVIATIRYYEGAHRVISTLFVDQNTFQPAQLPVGFEWAFSDEIRFGASDLRLDRTSTQHITQTPLSYELFSGNITSATDFIQFGLPVPSTPPTWKPSFRPSPPPSPVPSPNPSSSRPSFRPSTYRPTLLGDTNAPTQTDNPTGFPTGRPTYLRGAPSGQPTGQPAPAPTWKPSLAEKSLTPTRRLSPAPTTVSPSVKSSPMPTLAKLEDDDQSYSINWNALYISITGIIVVGYATLSYLNCRKNKVSPAPAPTPEDIALMNFTDMVVYEIFNQEIADAVTNMPLEKDDDNAVIMEEQSEYRSASPVEEILNPNQDASDSDDSFNRFFKREVHAFNQEMEASLNNEEDSDSLSNGFFSRYTASFNQRQAERFNQNENSSESKSDSDSDSNSNSNSEDNSSENTHIQP